MRTLRHRPTRAALLVAALGSAAMLACSGAKLPAGDLAAALTLPTLDGDGAVFDPSVLRGKRVLLAFWRPGCPHCLEELPQLEAAVAGKSDYAAVTVMVSGSKKQGLAIARERGFTGPLLVDETGDLKKRLGIDRVPWTFVLRGDGTVAASLIGTHPSETLVVHLMAAN